MGRASVVVTILLACLVEPVWAAGPVIDVAEQVAAAHKVLAGLGLTQARDDRMVSANHGQAELVIATKPADLGITPDNGDANLADDQMAPRLAFEVAVWQSAEAAEAYSLQVISAKQLAQVTDTPYCRLREGRSAVTEGTVAGQTCFVFTKPNVLIGNNVTVQLEYKLAVRQPTAADPTRQRNLREKMKSNLSLSSELDFYRVAGLFAQSADQLGLFRRGGGMVKVVDANPRFTGGIALPFTTALSPDRIHQLTELAATRRGAVADGLSALLLVAKVPAKGKVAWQLANAPADGLLVRLPSTDPANWRAGAAGRIKDVPVVELTKNADGTKSCFAFGLYLPPSEFGASYATSGRLLREVSISFRYESVEPGVKPHTEQVPIQLARPPVVLVHGTYDNPSYCWQQGEPALGGVSLFDTLVQAGYRFPEDGQPAVFAVDYEGCADRQGRYHSSGLSNKEQQVDGPGGKVSSSCFANNANVVYDNPQGIWRAIDVYRSHRLAATQADLVCHSLGGLVTRLYARGFPLGQTPPPAHYGNPEACRGCWYHRGDNYQRGDIHRLITLCTTHRGSDLPGLLRPYERIVADPAFGATTVEKQMVNGLLYTVDWLTGNGGAFQNQEPGCAELGAIGATPIPAHALAATCSWRDIQQFNSFYHGRLSKIYAGSPQRVLVEAFRRRGMPHTAANLDRLINAGTDRDLILMAFWQGVFGNTPNDFTVRLDSASGGLRAPYLTVLPGVLHGYATRYPQVQTAVRDLLTGPADRFAAQGFPPAGGLPANVD